MLRPSYRSFAATRRCPVRIRCGSTFNAATLNHIGHVDPMLLSVDERSTTGSSKPGLPPPNPKRSNENDHISDRDWELRTGKVTKDLSSSPIYTKMLNTRRQYISFSQAMHFSGSLKQIFRPSNGYPPTEPSSLLRDWISRNELPATYPYARVTGWQGQRPSLR